MLSNNPSTMPTLHIPPTLVNAIIMAQRTEYPYRNELLEFLDFYHNAAHMMGIADIAKYLAEEDLPESDYIIDSDTDDVVCNGICCGNRMCSLQLDECFTIGENTDMY